MSGGVEYGTVGFRARKLLGEIGHVASNMNGDKDMVVVERFKSSV